jgi:hypothetical protein
MAQDDVQRAQDEWISFPGGELEGQPPRVLCPACRDAVLRAATARPGAAVSSGGSQAGRAERMRTLCFQCYRANLDRRRALRAAADVPVSEEHFQSQLPFEPVNSPRLERLKAERSRARVLEARGAGRFVSLRREAQIAARRTLEIAAAVSRRRQPADWRRHDRGDAFNAAVHAVELQFPESWLPFIHRTGGACSAHGK